jgi:transposase-like protein
MEYSIRRKFTDEFKRQAVQFSVSSPATLVEIGLQLNIHPNMLCRWRREWIMDKTDSTIKKPVKNKGPNKSILDLERENKRLKKKLERANLELDILKKLEEYAIKEQR